MKKVLLVLIVTAISFLSCSPEPEVPEVSVEFDGQWYIYKKTITQNNGDVVVDLLDCPDLLDFNNGIVYVTGYQYNNDLLVCEYSTFGELPYSLDGNYINIGENKYEFLFIENEIILKPNNTQRYYLRK